jgi:hypothetical protein
MPVEKIFYKYRKTTEKSGRNSEIESLPDFKNKSKCFAKENR